MKNRIYRKIQIHRFTRLVVLSAFLLAVPCPLPAAEMPGDWQAWADRVEKVFPVSDDQGHGPDIGSSEWMQALSHRLGIIHAEGHGPDLGSNEWRQAVEHKLAENPPAMPMPAKPVEMRELLSAHETVAEFDGLRQHICRGLTTLCPDHCGHSGRMAVFTITKYLRYEKPGEYGDAKQEIFEVLVDDNHGQPKVPDAIREAILAMKPGKAVQLDWNHDYVTRDGTSFPERVITALSPIPDAP